MYITCTILYKVTKFSIICSKSVLKVSMTVYIIVFSSKPEMDSLSVTIDRQIDGSVPGIKRK